VYDAAGEVQMEGLTQRAGCTEPVSSQCWSLGPELGLLWRLLIGDWMLLTDGLSIKLSHIPTTVRETTSCPVSHFDHHFTGEDLKGAHVPPDW